MNTRTERSILFNRKNILEAADQLFLSNGVDKTTMDQIANESGYSKPTLYGYFKDKNEVFYALVYDFMKRIEEKVDKQIRSSLPFDQKFMNICMDTFYLADHYPLYFEGLIGNINVDIKSSATPIIYKNIYETGQNLIQKLVGMLQKNMRCQIIASSCDLNVLMLYIWSSVSGIIRMTLQKKEYLKMFDLNKKQFAEFSFIKLLNSVERNEVAL